MKVELTKLAHARSGDKGDTANVGVIALKDEFYPLLVREVTSEKVKKHFGTMVKGDVERFELPNLKALNFLLHESLGGGGTLSLMTDAQGKTFSTALLRMKIDIADAEAETLDLA
ncbi:MAG: AtuA-related protein [Pyrinomonadaceae bacterium]